MRHAVAGVNLNLAQCQQIIRCVVAVTAVNG